VNLCNLLASTKLNIAYSSLLILDVFPGKMRLPNTKMFIDEIQEWEATQVSVSRQMDK
jgi:hypothetical protein